VDTTTVIRIAAGLLFIAVLAVGIAYLVFVSSLLSKCSPSSRKMQPGMVWLMLIPFFNLVWNFVVVSAVADSLENEFRFRNIPLTEPKPGQAVGIAMAVCAACGLIPFVNLIAAPAHLILWIVYWVKLGGYSRQLDQVVMVSVPPVSPQGL
jgi:hypothetical protein